MRHELGSAALIPNGSVGSPAFLCGSDTPTHTVGLVLITQARARAQRCSPQAAFDSDPLASGRRSNPEEGSIAPLIVGTCCCCCSSVRRRAITGAYLQTSICRAGGRPGESSITRTMRTPDEASGSAAWEYASAYLAEAQPGGFSALRPENDVSVWILDQSVCTCRLVSRPPLLVDSGA